MTALPPTPAPGHDAALSPLPASRLGTGAGRDTRALDACSTGSLFDLPSGGVQGASVPLGGEGEPGTYYAPARVLAYIAARGGHVRISDHNDRVQNGRLNASEDSRGASGTRAANGQRLGAGNRGGSGQRRAPRPAHGTCRAGHGGPGARAQGIASQANGSRAHGREDNGASDRLEQSFLLTVTSIDGKIDHVHNQTGRVGAEDAAAALTAQQEVSPMSSYPNSTPKASPPSTGPRVSGVRSNGRKVRTSDNPLNTWVRCLDTGKWRRVDGR